MKRRRVRYDVFVSFKELGPDGKPTRDSVLASDIHEYLSSRQLSVFLSSIELKAQGVSAFKKAIDGALDASRVLVAVGTTIANLESEWVRYEWDGFLNDILTGVKPDDRLFTYIEGLEIKQLPRALRQTQAIIHRDGSLELLYRFITNAFNVDPVASKPVDKQRSEFQGPPEVERILQNIDGLIYALANFDSNPDGTHYGAVKK